MATLSSSDRREGETQDNAHKADIDESLEKSYLLMKTKLDELEHYNRTLESQLGSIFSSISKTVIKVKSEPAELRESDEESETNWKSVRPSSRSDEDVVSCQALAGTQPNTNSILHINENCQELVKREATPTQVNKEKGDLSEILRELRVSDIGDLKRALLLKKTQRSFSAVSRGGEDRPYLDAPTDTRNENVPIKFQEHHISLARSDLNNNNTKSNETEHIQSKESGVDLASLPPTAPPSQRSLQPKKYFTPTRTIKTERSRSTGDNPMHYQFYPGDSTKFHEVWKTHCSESLQPSQSRVLTLENIIENEDYPDKAEARRSEGLRTRRFLPLESPPYRTLTDIKTCKSDRYSSKTQSIDGFPQNGHKNAFSRESSSQAGYSEQRLTMTSSSSLSPPSTSSFSSIYASTMDCPTTEDESGDKNTKDANLVDEFFLFPYEVLDQNFDDICLELSRFSADIDLSQRAHLKAAKASDEWNTLWIYRGV